LTSSPGFVVARLLRRASCRAGLHRGAPLGLDQDLARPGPRICLAMADRIRDAVARLGAVARDSGRTPRAQTAYYHGSDRSAKVWIVADA
jgi:hypothetical protein